MSKPTLLLIPGILCDEFVWQHQLQALKDDFNLQVGHYHGVTSFEAQARQLLDSVEGPFMIAAHSMGAKIAIVMAHMEPDRISKMVLMSTSVDPLQPGEPSNRLGLLARAYRQGMPAIAKELVQIMLHPDHFGDQALVAGLEHMIAKNSLEELENQLQASLERPDLEAWFSHLTQDVAILCGAQDGWVTLAQQEHMKALQARAVLHIHENTGHMLPLEKKAEVSDFLRKYLLS